MGKRIQPVVLIDEVDEFLDNMEMGSTLELPTADEFVCTGDEVREECAMLGVESSYE